MQTWGRPPASAYPRTHLLSVILYLPQSGPGSTRPQAVDSTISGMMGISGRAMAAVAAPALLPSAFKNPIHQTALTIQRCQIPLATESNIPIPVSLITSLLQAY